MNFAVNQEGRSDLRVEIGDKVTWFVSTDVEVEGTMINIGNTKTKLSSMEYYSLLVLFLN